MRRTLLLLALLNLPCIELQGQSADSVLQGRVFRAGDSTVALAGVEVTVVGLSLSTRTDSTGRFRLTGLERGPHTVTFRLFGYSPASRAVTVGAGGSPLVSIALTPAAQELRQVKIAGFITSYPPRFEEQYKRASHANGRFFTREQIDSLQPFDTKSLLALIPTVLVNDRGITFQKCQSAFSGVVVALDPHIQRLGAPQMTGNVQVYVDGVRRTRFGDDADAAIRTVSPWTIQLMEVYTGTARIPGEFLDDACAVIAIWTKRY